jgi:hypothetical protein
LEKLSEKVERDEKTQKLYLWGDILENVNHFYPVADIRPNLSKFQEDFTEFKQDEEKISKLVLLDLYEKGIEAIESLDIYDKCPLCDQPYEGNLIEHIKSKQSHLDELSKRRKELEKRRKGLLSSIDGIIQKIEHTSSYLEEKELEPPLIEFEKNLKNIKSPLKECTDILEKKIESIDKEFDFLMKVDTKEFESLLDSESGVKEELSKQVENLEKDESRKALVNDFQQANKLQESFLKWNNLNKKIERLEEIKSTYEKIRDDYIEDTKKSLQVSFDAISYKFLSESQLNSFGLSIFLASAKHFNPNFKFIILDDVINSFDTYKRPRVIDLLSEHFSDYQILLFTHDSIWLDRLQKSFPQWIRKRFFGWDYAIGPRIEPGKNSYEQIDELLSQDKPIEAGWMFGRYLEWILQELCENLESSVKYNRRNEYTLSELSQAFRDRMKRKLKENHSIVKLILNFEADIGFRNFCDHWKESETDYTSPEIRDIIQNWTDIESKIECDKCHKFIRYEKVDGYEHISCPCRKLNLKAEEYYEIEEETGN